LGEEEEGDEDEPAGVELLGEIEDDTLAMDEEATIGLLSDEEEAIGLFRDEELAELLEITRGIDVLTLLILLEDFLLRRHGQRTRLKRQNRSRKRYSGT